jgi:excisionase family DNA binding protein
MADNIKAVQLMTVPEAAASLAVSQKTIWQWIYQRKIASTLIGRSRRIPTSAVQEFVDRGMVPAVDSVAA